MRIVIANLTADTLTIELDPDSGKTLRLKLQPQGKAGAIADIGGLMTPYEVNRAEPLRTLREAGSISITLTAEAVDAVSVPIERREVTFDNADLSVGVLTINHALRIQYPGSVLVYDDNDAVVIPDAITATDANTLDIDLFTHGVISGTWRVVILA